MKRILTLSLLLSFIFSFSMARAEIIDFEDLTLAPESFWKGSDGSGGFMSKDAFFNNNYDFDWDSWDGFSYSNRTDTQASDWQNAQYIAIPGEGVEGSGTYVVGYVSVFAQSPPTVTFPEIQVIQGAYFTNNNYAYYSMLNGDAFAKKFEEGDWFKLTITGKDASGNMTDSVDLFLAEGTDIANTWIWTDLSSLGEVLTMEFTLTSSDTGEWGMNTPAYFCMDNLNITTPSTGSQGSGRSQMYPTYMGVYPLAAYFNPSSSFRLYMGVNPSIGYLTSYPYSSYPMTYPWVGSGKSYYAQTKGSYFWNYDPGVYPLTGLPGTYSFSKFQSPYPMQPFVGNYISPGLFNYSGIYSGSGYLWSYPYW